MKLMKKMMALVIAMVMVLAMALPALAADKYKVTIDRNSTDEGKHTYVASQIFKGDLSQKDGKSILSNITWGEGVNQTKLGDLATAINSLRDTTATGYKALTAESTAAEFASAIGELNAAHDSATAQAVASAFASVLNGHYSGTEGETGVTDLDAGYYLIQDKEAPTATAGNYNSGAMTRYILQVLENVNVDEKASVPSVQKKVKDVTDSTATQSDYQDSADYDIGDDVPFQITGTTASTVHDYIKYHVTFVDDQSNGLSAPEQFEISVLGKNLTLNNTAGASATATVGDIKVTASIVTAGADFSIKVEFENTTSGNKLGEAVDSKDIVISYTSVLNNDAKIGATGNPNEVHLLYSNNPNSTDGREEGETPKDKVIVFTYQTEITKVDEENKALEGAEFTLYKEVASSYEDAKKVQGSEIITQLKNKDASINTAAIESEKYYIAKEMTLQESSKNIFEFKGIDDGTYVLVETKIPAGHNAYVAEKILVSAEHDVEADDPKLTALKADKTFTTSDLTEGKLSGTIINQSGSLLPSTGGIGTTIFYIIGSILVIGAGVLLVVKKRMSAE